MEDRELIEQFQSGNKQAFNQLVNKYRDRIYAVIYRMLRNQDDALDISQEVFVRAYRSLNKFRGDSSVYTWLYRIAVNLSINYINRNKHRKSQAIDNVSFKLSADNESPQKKIEVDELSQAIEQAVLKLPDKQRAVFVMRYYENMQHNEIAEILGNSVGSVKANYHHALQKLKVELKDFA